MEAVLYICLGILLIFGVSAIMLPSMIKSAIALAAASATLGFMMYVLHAEWAAIFEISVCSGLVTVIFISAISLSNVDKKEIEKKFEDKKQMALLPLVLIISGIVLVIIAISIDFSLPPGIIPAQAENRFMEILWNNRQADIWGQIIIILTGTIAVVVLFKEREEL